MIVGTAGHVDHGKTALIRALTGTDTDRLKEEKRRGISIDLGFAYLRLPNGEAVGFVDVPGHERFIRNMLAGAGAIDFALMVVAADDGIMPQTVEHASILDLLGVSRGMVALTKCDLVDEARVAEVKGDIDALLGRTSLAGCPLFRVSSRTGAGTTDLARALERDALASPLPAARGNFRLAVDRCFSLPGAGTIVTGTVCAGRVDAGDDVLVSPSGLHARVRALRAQNQPAAAARSGERCALNLIGRRIDTGAIARGDWIVAAHAHSPTERLDADLRVLRAEPRPLRHWTAMHLHHGTGFSVARVAILDGKEIAPGAHGLVQLVLDRPIAALYGDRFVLREVSAQRTVAGGRVLDPFAQENGRRSPGRLTVLRSLREPDPARALLAALSEGPAGLEIERFARARNLDARETQALAEQVPHELVRLHGHALAVDPQRWQRLCEAVKAALGPGGGDGSGESGWTLREIRARLVPQAADGSELSAVLDALVAQGRLLRSESRFRLRPDADTLPDPDSALRASLADRLAAAGCTPPKVCDLASSLPADEKRVRRALMTLASRGTLSRVSEDRFFASAALEALAERIRALLASEPAACLSTARLRDGLGIGRNLAVEVLEHFDRRGLTERTPEGRRLRQPRGQEQRKGHAPGGASGLQIRKGPSAVPGGFDSHSLPPPDNAVA